MDKNYHFLLLIFFDYIVNSLGFQMQLCSWITELPCTVNGLSLGHNQINKKLGFMPQPLPLA